MEPLNSGELKKIFRDISCIALIGLIASGKHAWQEEEETRKYFSPVLILQEQLFISELFMDIQDAILLILHYRTMLLFRATSSNIFYHIGCAFNLHSIINSVLIPGGQNSSKRQTVFFLPVDPMDKSHEDPEVIDLNVPRHAQYLHNAWKRHQGRSILGRHQSCY